MTRRGRVLRLRFSFDARGPEDEVLAMAQELERLALRWRLPYSFEYTEVDR